MTRRPPHDRGESPGSVFGIWLCGVLAIAWIWSVMSLLHSVFPGGLR